MYFKLFFRGKDHSFLGMEIEVTDGVVKLSMKKQINKLITEFETENGTLDNEVSRQEVGSYLMLGRMQSNWMKRRVRIFIQILQLYYI